MKRARQLIERRDPILEVLCRPALWLADHGPIPGVELSVDEGGLPASILAVAGHRVHLAEARDPGKLVRPAAAELARNVLEHVAGNDDVERGIGVWQGRVGGDGELAGEWGA